ncbi:MAG: amino acid adenylation domain-containing protein [Acidobacteriota bacterium]|nr:amino acid adenylation domain-containing protein [Acidobacteriota bacterium]
MQPLLHELLEISAQRHPHRQAVVDRRGSCTYEELDERSSALAQTLRDRGVRKGDRVGILLPKSIDTVVAIFGVLKAGAAYVPLDSFAPRMRLRFMIEDCAMKALISTAAKWRELDSSVPCIEVQDNRVIPSAARVPLHEEDLAYILYTSGSTGTPKGVTISHRASLTFVNWAHGAFHLTETDRVSSHAPFHFDLSIFDIFSAIKAGAAVILVPPELSVFPLDLATFIDEQRVSVWYSVPSILIQLATHGDLRRFRFENLRAILFAGEVFPVRFLRELMKQIPHPEYFNLYGPTEVNVVTWYRVGSEIMEEIPIGKAIDGVEVFVVDGELVVRGPCVMSGYWGDSAPPQRVYHTGDMVRQLPDGNFLFLGRHDNMVKRRGYRIALEEIESTLSAHPDVAEVAVVAAPDEENGAILKAFIGSRTGVSAAGLERFCAERIPRYMIPDIFEFRASLPKTSTGKTDRSLLRKKFSDDVAS